MIYVIISADLFPGKAKEAPGVFQRVADYMRENTPELSYQALRNSSGSVQRIHGLMTYQSIADWDIARAKRAADPKWQAIVTDVITVIDLHNADVQFCDVLAQS